MKALISIFLLLPFYSFAQLSLSGTIKNNEAPVAFANIIINNQANEFVKGTTTNDDGSFELELEKGTYQLTVSHLNFEAATQRITIEEDLQIDPILLKSNASELDEVIVTAHKKMIRREIDRTVVNIEDSPLAQSGNIFDALKSTPGLMVQNESIVMLGKSNIRIAVDGRMVELSGEELNNFLRSLSASDVKEIEVMTNPSARYEAEGNSGIVNIITKRINKNAWRNNFSATHNQARYGWQQFNNNFSYQKNKFSFLLSTAINTGDRFIKQLIEPYYSEQPQRIDSEQIRNATSISPRLILDYQVDDNTTLGVQYLGSWGQVRQLDDLSTTIFNRNFEAQQFLKANDTQFDQDRNNATYNLYFDKRLDTLGKRITFNFDVLDYRGATRTNVWSERFDESLNFIDVEFANSGDATYQIDNYSAKLDMEHPTDWVKLSYGAKASFSSTDYRLDNFNTISGAPVFIPSQSNSFDFQEQIHAAYFNGFKKLNDKWEIQFGLRTEYTQTKGISASIDIGEPIFENSYWKVFPTFYTRYTKNDKHVFSLNYGRRINRPAYSQLNPARSFLSGQSSQQGNPFLLPSFSDNLELTHNYNHNLSTTLTLRRTTDAYSFLFDLNDETQQQNITYKNLFNENNISLVSSYQFSFTKWWTGQALLFYSYSLAKKINPSDNITLMNKAGIYGSMNNRLTLNKAKTITGEANFWYISPYSANIYSFEKAYSLDLAVSFKDVIKGMNLTIGAYDIFDSSPRTSTSIINNVRHGFIARPSNRYVRVSLSYGFGNEKINKQERRFGNEEVRSRSN